MVSAIILAAGSGSRMKSDKAKQFIEINGKPLMYYSIRVFDASVVDEIILVTRGQDIDYVRKEIVEKYGFNKVRKVIAGGKERFESVSKGLKVCDKRNKIVNEDGFGVETPDRNTVYQIQTPQTFDRKLLEEAYDRLRVSGDRDITDDTMILERYMDVQSKMIEGSYENIKVTTPEDIKIASLYL